MNWWYLPGPRSFVDAVIQDLREQNSVFLHLPEHYPDRLSSIFREQLQEDYRWISLTVHDANDPVEFLYEMCVPEVDRRKLRSVQSLIGESHFQGQIIWIDAIPVFAWDVWQEFFVEYAWVTRPISPSRQTHFVVHLKGSACAFPLSVAVGITKREWNGWVRRSDMLLHGGFQIEEKQSSLETDLTRALVTNLAGWDPDLCDWLSTLSLEQLIDPTDHLLTFANGRNWKKPLVDLDYEAWTLGYWQTIEERPVLHNSLAARSGGNIIERLVWRAEVGILMPYIEERRQDLLKRHTRYLTVPFRTKDGINITNILDLEIGHIEFQLSKIAHLPSSEMKSISSLKRARNSLSHLEPIEKTVLLFICEQSRNPHSL